MDKDKIKDECELCKAEKITEWLYEDEICWIARCKTCGGWMIVLRHHGEPTEGELQHLQIISKRFFPTKRWRRFRRVIKNHWHEHFIDL